MKQIHGPIHRNSWRKPSRITLLFALIVAAVAYLPLNRPSNPHILTAALNREIPLVTPFAVPYIPFLPIFWVIVLYAYLTDRKFIQLACTALVVYIVSDITFATFQTYVPRPHIGGGLFPAMVGFIYSHDHPYNDLPSEHASSATMLALYFFALHHRWRYLIAIGSLIVVLSTLFVKQHSVAGAAGGVLLAVVSWIAVNQARRLSAAKSGVEQNRLNRNRQKNSGRELRDSGAT
ncbi:MAG TPA: phosphatase PAP2 family protein [Solirubrobacteraceae bacterium]|jgi:hypothetical protein|nr:phosphatase PAP2 family protein [Solirubrobacteraceae bacterium]